MTYWRSHNVCNLPSAPQYMPKQVAGRWYNLAEILYTPTSTLAKIRDSVVRV
jgi:hypothetical protein